LKKSVTSRFTNLQIALFIVLFWTFGLIFELILIGHYEGWLQYSPLIILGLGFVAYLTIKHSGIMKTISMLTVFVGIVGIGLHLKNNMEFELEMYPQLTGWDLIKGSLTGALPVLALGALIPVGLLGLMIIKIKNENNGHE